jgi:hypothetical protein
VAPILPSPATIAQRALALDGLCEAASEVGRELLRALMLDGRIYFEPHAERSFTLRGELLPCVMLAPDGRKPPAAVPRAACATQMVAGVRFADGIPVLHVRRAARLLA